MRSSLTSISLIGALRSPLMMMIRISKVQNSSWPNLQLTFEVVPFFILPCSLYFMPLNRLCVLDISQFLGLFNEINFVNCLCFLFT